MSTPRENPPQTMSREQAEQAGFTLSAERFERTAREVLESFRGDLMEGEIQIVEHDGFLHIAFKGANPVAISALLIRMRMRAKRASGETARLSAPLKPSPAPHDGDIKAATERITQAAREVRDAATRSFKRPKPPQQ